MPTRTKEETVKDKIKAILNAHGIPFDMPATHGYGKSGNFDFVCIVEGAYMGIEAKRDAKEPPTQLQTDHAKTVIEAGGVALLIHKGNLERIATAITVIRRRLLHRPINTGLNYWPEPPPQDDDDDDVKVIKGKKK